MCFARASRAWRSPASTGPSKPRPVADRRCPEGPRLARLIETVAGVEVNLRWRLLNTYTGLILPLIASATAPFLFRQFFQTIPDELVDASQIDGASPMQFMTHILLPLSRTNIAALAVILFLFGWNQYLWPLLVAQEDRLLTVVVGIQRYINAADTLPVWNEAMALTIRSEEHTSELQSRGHIV